MSKLNLSPRRAAKLYAKLEKEREKGKTTFKPYKKHEVVCRERKDGKPGFRYEFVNGLSRLVTNANNAVYRIDGTLTPDRMKVRGVIGKRGLPKQRLMKYEIYPVSRSPADAANKEYRCASKAGLLHVKKPVIIGNKSYLTMQELPGRELAAILKEDQSLSDKRLSIPARLELTIALLEALRDQVTRQGLLHRDIKPENILVDFIDGKPQIYLVDYGFSVEADQNDKKSAGSYGYAANELVQGLWSLQSPKTDIFAMACVLVQIWRISPDVILDYKYAQFAASRGLRHDHPAPLRGSLETMFGGIKHELDKDWKRHIKATLYNMMDPDPLVRTGVDEAISLFRDLMPEHKAPLGSPAPICSSAACSSDMPVLPEEESISGDFGRHSFFAPPPVQIKASPEMEVEDAPVVQTKDLPPKAHGDCCFLL